jgi:hypothetical protein
VEDETKKIQLKKFTEIKKIVIKIIKIKSYMKEKLKEDEFLN